MNFFIRFYIESYFEFAIAAFVQIDSIAKIDSVSTANMGFNLVLCCIMTVISTQISLPIAPIYLFYFIHKNSHRYTDSSFAEKFNAIFEEFAPGKGTYYYVYFLLRRLSVALVLVLLKRWPLAQFIITSLLCISV